MPVVLVLPVLGMFGAGWLGFGWFATYLVGLFDIRRTCFVLAGLLPFGLKSAGFVSVCDVCGVFGRFVAGWLGVGRFGACWLGFAGFGPAVLVLLVWGRLVWFCRFWTHCCGLGSGCLLFVGFGSV